MNLLTNQILPPSADPSDPNVRSQVGKRCSGLGICANVLLFAGKMLAGILSGSVSITADALNNLSDASSAIVTFLGFKLAEKPADGHHPYGHARYEYLSSLAVAVMILFIGFELAKSSIGRIIHPTAVEFTAVTAGVLTASIAVKFLMNRINRTLSRRIESTALAATAADSRNDCIATGAVLLAGLIQAATGVSIDGLMGLAVAIFILYSGLELARDTISPLLGENADPELQRLIIQCVRSDDKVLGYHDLMVHDYGPGQRFASIHVEMDHNEDPLLCHTIIDNIERKCLTEHRVHLVIHYDPIITDDEELNALRGQVGQILGSISPEISFHDFRMVKGRTHTNLIFDVTLPDAMKGQENRIKQQLEDALNDGSDTRYYAVITFDSEAFNTQKLWN